MKRFFSLLVVFLATLALFAPKSQAQTTTPRTLLCEAGRDVLFPGQLELFHEDVRSHPASEWKIVVRGDYDLLGWINTPPALWPARNDSVAHLREELMVQLASLAGYPDSNIVRMGIATGMAGATYWFQRIETPTSPTLALSAMASALQAMASTQRFLIDRVEKNTREMSRALGFLANLTDSVSACQARIEELENLWGERKETSVNLLAYGDDFSRYGGGLQVDFSSGCLVGADISGRDWNNFSALKFEAWAGKFLYKSFAITAGFVYESDLAGYWTKLGGVGAFQIHHPITDRLNFFFSAGARISRVYQQEELGRVRLMNDPEDPYVIRLKQAVITPASRFWTRLEPDVKIGLSFQLNQIRKVVKR